jgi:hypothetical protein
MADFREGLLPARKAAAISAHLSSCPRCAELDAQLASVTSLLAAIPAPPMPASLVARLDAALAAETAARAAAASPATTTDGAARGTSVTPDDAAQGTSITPDDAIRSASVTDEPVAGTPAQPGSRQPGPASPGPAPHGPAPATPALRGRRRAARAERAGRGPGRGGGTRPPSRLALRIATAAAAIVLVAGGGYAITRVLAGGSTASTAASSPGAVHSNVSRSSASGLAPVAQPATAAGVLVVRSGTSYRAGQLPAQVRSVLRRFPAPAPSPSAVHAARPARAAAAFPQLAACVSRVAGAAVPRLIDIASYRGRPVAVIVVPVTGSSRVRVWLVGTACPAHGGDVIAHFSMPGTG